MMITNKPKTEDGRNLIDYYWYWTNEAIVADLDTKRHNFSVLISNLQNDFNIGSVVRSANAFLAEQVIIYGRKKYDRRGAVGTHNYTHFQHVREMDDLDSIVQQFDIVIGIDNIANASPVEDYQWQPDRHTLICFGQEHIGLPQEIIQLCHHVLYIKQYGSVRSLNVGCASSIVMYDYCHKVSEKN